MRKIVLLSVLGVVGLGVLIWLDSYLSTGTVVISTNNKNSTVTLQGGTQGNSYNAVGLGTLSATVKHGRYIATVKSGTQTSVQAITLTNGHKTLRLSMNLSGLAAVEPVAYQNAEDVTADSNQLLYLDSNTGYLYKIDGQNDIANINSSQSFKAVRWANTSFGVGQDANGHLYAIVGSFVSPLNVPFSYDGKPVNFAVVSNDQIYVSHGGDVYRGDPSGNFKKIYTSHSSNPLLAANTKTVAIGDDAEDEDDNDSPVLALVSTSGGVTKTDVDGEVGDLLWSPDGQHLVSVSEAFADVYDASLHQIATVPASSSVGHVAWLNNNEFLYSTTAGLWSYDISNARATLLATLPPLAGSITGLTISSDKAFAYFTTTNSGSSNTYAIRRIGLNGQQAPAYVYSLQNILPLTLNDSSASLVNFSGPPTILVEPSPDSALAPQGYLQEAQAALTQDGFDISQLQFTVGQGS